MMNYYDDISTVFADKPIFTRSEFDNYVKTRKPTLNDSSSGWLLYNLCQRRVIQRVARNLYRLYSNDYLHKEYKPNLTIEASEVLEYLIEQFPLITFIVWETKAFNEFANHQIHRNFVFVEAEKMCSESVFNKLREQCGYMTLYKPCEKEISLYSSDVTVVVLPLISESPINGHYTRLEKMLVDLFASKLLNQIISKSDFAGIYEEAFARYSVNYNMMMRYAKRRNKKDVISSFIMERTNIASVGKESFYDNP